jgi:hypothetical protein
MNLSKNSLEYISQLINENHLDEAMEVLTQNADKSMWLQNARAVCWMRTGQAGKAIEALTPLVYRSNSVAIDLKVHEIVILNLATARLLAGNVLGAVSLLAEVRKESPMRRKLESAVKDWKQTQPMLARIAFALGLLPSNTPVPLDFPAGQP